MWASTISLIFYVHSLIFFSYLSFSDFISFHIITFLHSSIFFLEEEFIAAINLLSIKTVHALIFWNCLFFPNGSFCFCRFDEIVRILIFVLLEIWTSYEMLERWLRVEEIRLGPSSCITRIIHSKITLNSVTTWARNKLFHFCRYINLRFPFRFSENCLPVVLLGCLNDFIFSISVICGPWQIRFTW